MPPTRRAFFIVSMLIMLFAATLPAEAVRVTRNSAYGGSRYGRSHSQNAATKFVRGLVNTTTGWFEIPKQIGEVTHESGAASGLTWGLIRGLGYGFVRTAAGLYDVVTFPFPAPPDYAPLMQPEYVFSEDRYSK